MIRGARISAQALLPRIRAQEVIAHNLANVESAGFQRQRLAFHAADGPAGVHRAATRTDTSPGTHVQTGSAFDLALDGPGYFVVDTPQGERLTRAGSFQLSGDGQLVTPSGHPVLGEAGRLDLPPGDIHIAGDGVVWVDGEEIDRLRLNTAPEDSLMLESGALFRATGGLSPVSENTQIRQGYVERANVEAVVELVEMIRVFREFESNHQAMTTQGETLRRWIDNELR